MRTRTWAKDEGQIHPKRRWLVEICWRVEGRSCSPVTFEESELCLAVQIVVPATKDKAHDTLGTSAMAIYILDYICVVCSVNGSGWTGVHWYNWPLFSVRPSCRERSSGSLGFVSFDLAVEDVKALDMLMTSAKPFVSPFK